MFYIFVYICFLALSLYLYIYIYISLYVSLSLSIYIYIYMYLSLSIYIYIYISLYIYIYIYVCLILWICLVCMFYHIIDMSCILCVSYHRFIFVECVVGFLRSVFRISNLFLRPRPWRIEIRHRVKRTSTIHLIGFETLQLKIRRLKLWKPTVGFLCMYTRSPLQDSRLFGPSPWKILALIV